MEARLIPQRQTSVVDEVQVPGNLLKPVTGYPRCYKCVVELLITGPIVSDLWESVDTHDNHETKVCLDLCHVCLPCGCSICSCKTLCCKPVCLPYNQREDLLGPLHQNSERTSPVDPSKLELVVLLESCKDSQRHVRQL